MARTKQTRRKSIAPKQPPRRLASPDPSDDESSDDEPAGGSEARFQDARPCAICGGPVLQETEYNEDGRGSQPSHAWLQDACVLKAGEDKPPPWERKQLRRDVHAAAAERRHDAGAAGSRWREAAEAEDEAPPSPTDSGYDTWRYESCQYGAIDFDPLGDEDEHGDWDWELRLMRRMTFYADARVDGNWARVSCLDGERCGSVKVCDWRHDHGSSHLEGWGFGLIMHSACAGERRPQRHNGHLVRSGCPDAPQIQYGGGVEACWQGRTFVAPPGSDVLAEPHLRMPPEVQQAGQSWLADGRPVAAPLPGPLAAAAWQPQPHSSLLGLPVELLDTLVGAPGEQQGLVLLAALGRCCRQLRAYAAARLPPARPDPGQARCRQAAPFISWSELKQARQAWCRQQGGAPVCPAPNWRAAAGALPAALERRRASSACLRNALRITGLVRGMIEALLEPLSAEEAAAVEAEEAEEAAAQRRRAAAAAEIVDG